MEFHWIALVVTILLILVIDLRVSKTMSFREALVKTIIYILIALAFNGLVWFKDGSEAGMQFLAGYLVEFSLSIDNLFIFLILFSFFKVTKPLQNRVLFWGIFGALIMRAFFIFAGAALLERFYWVIYVFGAFLILTALKMLFQKNHESDPETHLFVRMVRKILPITKTFHGSRFFVRENGKLWATPLFLVLVLVETTDIIFAADSIPAVFAVTRDPFIVFASNVLAIMGLRALYFCIANLMDRFVYLKPAICLILAFVGVKMLVSEHFEIPTTTSLLVIVCTLGVAALASVLKNKPSKSLK